MHFSSKLKDHFESQNGVAQSRSVTEKKLGGI